MIRRLLALALAAAFALSLGGCWSYKSLDQVNIVLGIAVDFNKETDQFEITCEVADLAAADKGSAIEGRIIQSTGNTLFEAVRNAKRKEADKLFFGSTNILVISEEIARERGVDPIIDWFQRDGECRETLQIVLSQEDTAEAILQKSEERHGIVSIDLHDILQEDVRITASSRSIRLFELYHFLNSLRRSAMLPAIHMVANADQQVAELNGIAVLREDKLQGFFTPDESKYAQFIEGLIKGGVLTLSVSEEDEAHDISLEIFDNTTKKSFTHDDGKITIEIKTKTYVVVDENRSRMDMMDPEVIKKIQGAAEDLVESGIRDTISIAQQEFQTDIFGFGEMIYERDYSLWKTLESSWMEIYPTVEIKVSSEIVIRDSAFIK